MLRDSFAAYTPGVSERRAGVSTFLHSGLKDATAQTSAAQSVTATRVYDAFGMVVASTGTWKGPFGYAGEHGYQEESTGLQLLGHRYYDPSTGRFLTRDPAKCGRNWYGYCANSPTAAVDPDGLDLTVITNNSGIEGWDWAAETIFSSGGAVMKHPSKKQLLQALIDEPSDSTVMIWGHGSYGKIQLDNGEWLTADDVRYVFEQRQRLNRGRLKNVWLRSCDTCRSKKWLNAWLSVSEDVFGFTAHTDKGPLQHWSQVVSEDPASRAWFPWGSDKKKDKKAKKKATVG